MSADEQAGEAGRRRGVLHVLTGPTAVGKTELALRWAEANGAEIVSCDSLLFYRGLDIGTAKPTVVEQARVRHHLIDCRDVRARMDVADYVRQARSAVEAITGRGQAVLVTGGSGFYLKAFFGPVADAVAAAPELRAEIEERLAKDGLEALVAELAALNPAGLGKLDTRNPRRVTRALERCRASGRTLAELAEDFARQPGAFADFEVRCTRLERRPEELNERIARRVRAMVAGGLVDEVRTMLGRGLRENPSAAGAIGYRETIAMLDGKLAEADLVEAITVNTRQLARKQRTWFRTQLPEHSVLAAASAEVGALFGG